MNKVLSIIKDLNPFSNKKVDNKIIYTLKILLSAFIVYFASLIIAEGIIIGVSYLFGYNATDKQMPYDIMLLCTFYGYLITILLFMLFTKKINKIELNKIGLDKNIKTFLKGILIGIVSLSLIIIPLYRYCHQILIYNHFSISFSHHIFCSSDNFILQVFIQQHKVIRKSAHTNS